MRSSIPPMTVALAILACTTADKNATADSPAAAATRAAATMPSTDPAFHPEWSRTAVIYEVNVRQYTPEGTFTALQTHLPRLKALGVDVLWLMPVQPIGVKNRKGKLGSYYAISDYTAINAQYGSEAAFKAFVDAAHQQGLRVILDWVANHTAHDHEWVTARPAYHERRADGSPINARDNEGKETDWTDVAELDYTNAELRRTMIDEMRWWVDRFGLDGFRCDVAGGVPMDFWVEARTAQGRATGSVPARGGREPGDARRVRHDVRLGAPSSAQRDRTGEGQHGVARSVLREAGQGVRSRRLSHVLHEQPRRKQLAGLEFERMGANHIPAFVLSATVQSSMPLLYTGQEVGMRKRLRFFEKDTVDWNGPSLASFYQSLFELKHQQPALANGPWGGVQTTLQTDGGPRVYAFTRTKDNNTVLVAVNFGDRPFSANFRRLTVPGAYTDWFSKGSVSLAADGTLEIPAHGYRVLVRK